VQPALTEIAEVLDHLKLDILQIYGAVEALPAIRARFGLPVWLPCGVNARADLPDDPRGADGLVVEAKPPAGADRPGGNATTFEWSILNGWRAPVPWLLAGGLTPDNVAMAIRETGAAAVDVASGVERTKGVKDPALIRAFVSAARDRGRVHPR
jgi:phosphoribosylanthranilate isomerase